MYYTTKIDDCISHHGILGQKWGVRRYQNPDGSLTPEGKERLYQDNGPEYVESKDNRIYRSAEAYRQKQIGAKYASKASDAEAHGNKKKAEKYRDLMRKANKNSQLYEKGLTKEEKQMGRYQDALNQRIKKGVAIGSTAGAIAGGAAGSLGGPMGAAMGAYMGGFMGIVGGVSVGSITGKTYKKYAKAADTAYSKWFDKKVSSIVKKKMKATDMNKVEAAEARQAMMQQMMMQQQQQMLQQQMMQQQQQQMGMW